MKEFLFHGVQNSHQHVDYHELMFQSLHLYDFQKHVFVENEEVLKFKENHLKKRMGVVWFQPLLIVYNKYVNHVEGKTLIWNMRYCKLTFINLISIINFMLFFRLYKFFYFWALYVTMSFADLKFWFKKKEFFVFLTDLNGNKCKMKNVHVFLYCKTPDMVYSLYISFVYLDQLVVITIGINRPYISIAQKTSANTHV